MSDFRFTRRQFLQTTGATALALSMDSLGFLGGKAHATEKVFQKWDYKNWEALHREEWKWDKVTYGTHLVDCYPGNCLWRVYTRDGLVWREEQAAKYPVVDSTGPDWNPRGCQKGCSYSNMMYNPDRVKYPMKRVGERGEGKWKRVSWDEAYTLIADAMIDALQKHGPHSIIHEPGPGNAGFLNVVVAGRLFGALGNVSLDLNSTIGDFNKGVYETFGKFQFMDSCDGWFFSKLLLIWHMNPVYTRIPSYHFISEARYNGAEVVTIAPDYSPSAIHADEWIPVEMGADAALGLGVAQELIARGTYEREFLKEQTDFAFLVRLDNERFLREEDIDKGGREDQFYFWDTEKNELAKASRGSLKLECNPALEGTYTVTLKDGKNVKVRPSFVIFKEMLDKEYTPEQASKICSVPAETIRRLADKAWDARGHVSILVGWNSSKYYHGDLIERAMCAILALTGSLGKKGSGIRGWNESLFDGAFRIFMRGLSNWNIAKILFNSTLNRIQMRLKDPDLTDEMIAIATERRISKIFGMTPPAFLYYLHSGYRDTWNKKEWHCPTMKRSFEEYFNEAVDSGWWDGFVRPGPDTPPQVYCFIGTSPARKNRGWMKNLYPSFWKNLKMIFTAETRWSTSALMADVVLPGAGFYEKLDVRFPTPHVPWLTITDQAVEPIGEAKAEWYIFAELARKIAERGLARGFTKYDTVEGRDVDIEQVAETQDLGFKDLDELLDTALQESVKAGTLPEGSNLEMFRREGIIRFTNMSDFDPVGMAIATDIKPDEPIVPLTYHIGPKKIPYPTKTRRIQFYIDHPWFIEAGEGHPVHKDNPQMGGDYPLRMTSGHQRWSVHSIWITDDVLARTHQGRPTMFMNTEDAKARGIEDGELVHVYNDFNDFKIHVKLTAAARSQDGPAPGQIIIYHAWEPFQFDGWKSYDAAIPGMIKWLDLAAGYGQLDFYRWNWATQPIDRAVAVEVKKV